MYRIIDSKGATVAVCSRKQDADAFLTAERLDKEKYKIMIDNSNE